MLALFLHKAMFGAKGSRSRKTASASTVALELQEALVNVSWAEAQ